MYGPAGAIIGARDWGRSKEDDKARLPVSIPADKYYFPSRMHSAGCTGRGLSDCGIRLSFEDAIHHGSLNFSSLRNATDDTTLFSSDKRSETRNGFPFFRNCAKDFPFFGDSKLTSVLHFSFVAPLVVVPNLRDVKATCPWIRGWYVFLVSSENRKEIENVSFWELSGGWY